jgi:hypothetical protein
MAEKLSIAMIARMASDLKIQIATEGRLPEAIMLIFPEPKRKGETAVRALQYAETERLTNVIEATAAATKPKNPARRGSTSQKRAASAATEV